ncbi:MAG: hypothetical protein J6O50_02425 [Ruminiclostridium sp.]|nr:hypothetical protein [Ruminiclostridium sp.]
MKFFKNVKEKITNKAAQAKARAVAIWAVAACNRGENYVDSGVKILIAVVIGALLLAGLYSLFGDTIMPTVTQRVQDMFDFKG